MNIIDILQDSAQILEAGTLLLQDSVERTLEKYGNVSKIVLH